MRIEGKIVKSSEERLVFGWASVSRDASGQWIVDSEGDVIEPADLEKAAYEFVMVCGEGGDNHERTGVAKLVESCVFTPEKCVALGLEQKMPTGWWVGFKVLDEEVWLKIKSGEYSMFSIGGEAVREGIENE